MIPSDEESLMKKVSKDLLRYDLGKRYPHFIELERKTRETHQQYRALADSMREGSAASFSREDVLRLLDLVEDMKSAQAELSIETINLVSPDVRESTQ